MHKCRTKLKHAQQIEHGKLTYLANISRRRPFQYIGQFSIKISYLPTILLHCVSIGNSAHYACVNNTDGKIGIKQVFRFTCMMMNFTFGSF